MKTALLTLLLVAFGINKASKASIDFKPVVVLELFTSEGCSSCPSADALLSKIIANSASKGLPVYSLAFHVDYWNRLGWLDTFSAKAFSERQRRYASVLHSSVYTPQLVVNGAKEMVGSDQNAIQNAMDEALKNTASVSFRKLSIDRSSPKNWKVNYELEGMAPDCDLHIAQVLKAVTTNVKRGENGGRVLHHSNVVDHFTSVVAKEAGSVEVEPGSIQKQSNSLWICYVQNRKTLKILTAVSVDS